MSYDLLNYLSLSSTFDYFLLDLDPRTLHMTGLMSSPSALSFSLRKCFGLRTIDKVKNKAGNTRHKIVVERALTLSWHSRHATFGVMHVKEFKSTLCSCHVTLAFFLQTRFRYPRSAAEKWRTLDLDARSGELFVSKNGRTRKYR